MPTDNLNEKDIREMADALRKSGHNIAFRICECGDRQRWLWGAQVVGQLWRTTADVRDKSKSIKPGKARGDLHQVGAGLLDIVDYSQD